MRIVDGDCHVDDLDDVRCLRRGRDRVGDRHWMQVRNYGSTAGDGGGLRRNDVTAGLGRAPLVEFGGHQRPVVELSTTCRQFDPVDVPAIAQIVVTEQVVRDLRRHHDDAPVGADHRIDAVPGADVGVRKRQFGQHAGVAVLQPDAAGAAVGGARRGSENNALAVLGYGWLCGLSRGDERVGDAAREGTGAARSVCAGGQQWLR